MSSNSNTWRCLLWIRKDPAKNRWLPRFRGEAGSREKMTSFFLFLDSSPSCPSILLSTHARQSLSLTWATTATSILVALDLLLPYLHSVHSLPCILNDLWKTSKLPRPCLCLKFSRPPLTKDKLLITWGYLWLLLSLISHPSMGSWPPTALLPPTHTIHTLYLSKPKHVNFLSDAYLSHCLHAYLFGTASNLPLRWNA